MIFVLHHTVREELRWVSRWTWSYQQGTAKNPGDTFAVSPQSYPSEREARAAIAKARKAFGSARMAKVVDSVR